MNLTAAVVGILAIAGLVVAWTSPRGIMPVFLAVGVVANAYAVAIGLATQGAPGFLLLMLSVPYWLLWLALFTLGGLRGRSGPAGDDGTLGSR